MKTANIHVYLDETSYVSVGVSKQIMEGTSLFRDAKVNPKQSWYGSMVGNGLWEYDKVRNSVHLFEFIRADDPYAGPGRRTILSLDLDDHFWVLFPFDVGQSGGGFMHTHARTVPFGPLYYKVTMVS